METYVEFRVYECPKKPNEKGKYIGKTPYLDQAVAACTAAKAHGGNYFVKGVRADGTEVLLL